MTRECRTGCRDIRMPKTTEFVVFVNRTERKWFFVRQWWERCRRIQDYSGDRTTLYNQKLMLRVWIVVC